MHLTVCPLHSLGSIPGRGGVFHRIFAWLITHTLGEEMGTAKASQFR